AQCRRLDRCRVSHERQGTLCRQATVRASPPATATATLPSHWPSARHASSPLSPPLRPESARVLGLPPLLPRSARVDGRQRYSDLCCHAQSAHWAVAPSAPTRPPGHG